MMSKAIRVSAGIEGNTYYKNMLDKYLASPRFSDRCKELKKKIEVMEYKKEKLKEDKARELSLF